MMKIKGYSIVCLIILVSFCLVVLLSDQDIESSGKVIHMREEQLKRDSLIRDYKLRLDTLYSQDSIIKDGVVVELKKMEDLVIYMDSLDATVDSSSINEALEWVKQQ